MPRKEKVSNLNPEQQQILDRLDRKYALERALYQLVTSRLEAGIPEAQIDQELANAGLDQSANQQGQAAEWALARLKKLLD